MWLILTLAVLAVGTWLGIRRKSVVLLGLTGVVFAVVTAGTAICWQGADAVKAAPDYGVLLGCALEEDGQGSEELVRRCQTALSWMQAHPDRMLIVSGGDPGGHGISEALVMETWLLDHGADAERILREDQAKDTRENLQFAKALAQDRGLQTEVVAIVTSDYHQTRACFLARQNGQQPMCVETATPMPGHLFGAVREVYAFFSEWLDILLA